jgi:hypothetical protein
MVRVYIVCGIYADVPQYRTTRAPFLFKSQIYGMFMKGISTLELEHQAQAGELEYEWIIKYGKANPWHGDGRDVEWSTNEL